MKRKIIGLVGKLGSGKDTVAAFLSEYGWQRVAFADALYQEVSQAYHLPIASLQHRQTKESPQPVLALTHCRETAFVNAALLALRDEDHTAGIDQSLSQRLNAPRSPRRILQTWGTEYRRARDGDDYWCKRVTHVLDSHPDVNFVVTDVRFPDEARSVQAHGGDLVRVTRIAPASPIIKTGPQDPRVQHASETLMDSYPVSYELINRDGVEGLVRLGADILKTFIMNTEADMIDEDCARLAQTAQ